MRLKTNPPTWKILLSTGACLAVFCSCSQDSALPLTNAVEIRLSGDISSLSTSTLTRVAIDKDHSQPLDVYFARIDQNEDGSYPDYTTVVAPLVATRAGGEGQKNISFTVPQFYQTRVMTNSTKLLGWYPAGTYKQADGTVTFDISAGTSDLMITNEVTGDKINKFGDAGRTFTFAHLLTKISVKAFGDASFKDTWGVIKSVKVKSQHTSCVVRLSDRSLSWNGSTDLALRNSGSDAVMGDVLLTGNTTSANAASCGYAMFKPTVSNTLTLVVETSIGGVRDITVTIPGGVNPQQFAAGTSYTITLEFKSIDILPTAAIAGWNVESSDINSSFPYQ